jgi:hypothetical protein
MPTSAAAMVGRGIALMYLSHRGDAGKTTGYYVPKAAQEEIRAVSPPGIYSKSAFANSPS